MWISVWSSLILYRFLIPLRYSTNDLRYYMALEKTNVSIVSKIALIVVIEFSIATFWVVNFFTTQIVTITSPTQAQSNYETAIIFCEINIQTIYSYRSSKCEGIKSLNIMEDFPKPIHMKQIGKSPSLFNFLGGLIVARALFFFMPWSRARN